MKRLLIVVDYQKDFVDGALGFPGAEALDGPIAEKIAAYRAAGDDVAFTLDTHGPGYAGTQEGKKLPVPHCIKGEPGWRLYGRTAGLLQSGDPVFEKPAFHSSLRTRGATAWNIGTARCRPCCPAGTTALWSCAGWCPTSACCPTPWW